MNRKSDLNATAPGLSIIIPVYNAEKSIVRCLHSITKQSYKDLEILCVDDGSSDSSAAIIQSLAARDSRIHYIPKVHSGQGETRNYGIEMAHGVYVMFMDSDDEITEDSLEILEKYIKEEKMDLFIFGFRLVKMDGSSEIVCTDPYRGTKEKFMKQGFQKAYDLTLMNAPWNKVIKRSVLMENDIRFHTDMSVYEDLLFSLNALKRADRVIVLPEALYIYYYLQPGSVLSKYHDDVDDCIHQLADEIDEYIEIYNLEPAYYYASLIHNMVAFSSKIRRNHSMSLKKRVKRICGIFATNRIQFYLKNAKTNKAKLRKQILLLKILSPAMKLIDRHSETEMRKRI